jgi:hypothetical protein
MVTCARVSDEAPTPATETASPPASLSDALRQIAQLTDERDRYKQLAELFKKELERLRDGQKTPRENVDSAIAQLAFDQMANALLAKSPPSDPPPAPPAPPSPPEEKTRKRTPHGRGILPENLPVETLVLQPEGAAAAGTMIGEEVAWRLAFRRGGFYRLKIVRPVFVVPREAAVSADAVTAAKHDGDHSPLVAAAQATEPATLAAAIEVAAQLEPEITAAALVAEAQGAEGVDPIAGGADPIGQLGDPSGPDASAAAPAAVPRVRDTTIVCAPAPDEMIPRGLPAPDLLAKILVAKFADKLPFRRQEGMYARERVALSTATMCGWAEGCHELAHLIVDAMHEDMLLHSSFIGIDSTGVLVQANERCKRGHFWVLAADRDHVLFRYSKRCSSQEPTAFLKGFAGTVIADALAVYDVLFGLPEGPIEGGCNSHARRYFYKALASDRERALIAIGYFNELFRIERQIKKLPPAQRLRIRQEQARPLVERFERWRAAELTDPAVAEGTPIRRAFNYTLNHWDALTRFLHDGRIPIHNNRSELELRRLVIGRANWLFVGSDDTAPWTCTFVSLIASCALHGLDPETYLRDIFRVLPRWPRHRVLELAPKFWAATRARLSEAELALPLGPITVPPNFVDLPSLGQAAK